MGPAEMLSRSLEAFNRRDEDGMIALQHPEIEYVPITAAMEGRVYNGPEETRAFLRSLQLDWEVFEARPESFYEREDRALALGTWYARGRGSGLELFAQRGGWFVVVRDGLIHRWRTYTEPDSAIDAFGVGSNELPDFRVDPP